MILSGSKDATLRQVQLVSLHGTEFFDIVFSHDDAPEQALRTRVGREAIYASPQVGDLVTIAYLMNIPTNIARRP
jgi:hypothetical protein